MKLKISFIIVFSEISVITGSIYSLLKINYKFVLVIGHVDTADKSLLFTDSRDRRDEQWQ